MSKTKQLVLFRYNNTISTTAQEVLTLIEAKHLEEMMPDLYKAVTSKGINRVVGVTAHFITMEYNEWNRCDRNLSNVNRWWPKERFSTQVEHDEQQHRLSSGVVHAHTKPNRLTLKAQGAGCTWYRCEPTHTDDMSPLELGLHMAQEMVGGVTDYVKGVQHD